MQSQEHTMPFNLFPRKKNKKRRTQKQQPEEILSMNRTRARRPRTAKWFQALLINQKCDVINTGDGREWAVSRLLTRSKQEGEQGNPE